jgi:hypothetical protein
VSPNCYSLKVDMVHLEKCSEKLERQEQSERFSVPV